MTKFVYEFVLGAYCLYGSFLIYASVHRAWATLPIVTKTILAPFAALYLVDVAFNVTAGSVLFLRVPHELTFTKRCDESLPDPGWRGKLARFVCSKFLNPFDPDHCK